MLQKMAHLGGLFGRPKTDHPLADVRELRAVLAELPTDDAQRAVDELADWLDSLLYTEDFPAAQRFEVVRRLDEAAQPRLRRLAREYLHSPRLAKDDEMRLWKSIRAFWSRLADNYQTFLVQPPLQDKAADALRAALPLVLVRLLAALATERKWDQMHYGPASAALWARLGQAFLVAEQAGVAMQGVQIYPGSPGLTCPHNEYLKAVVFEAAAMDSLLPFEIELAERLIANFLPAFVFGPEARPGSIYCVDLAGLNPPARLVRMPAEMAASLRFFQPGAAHAEMQKLLHALETGEDVPADVNLGGQYQARVVLPVLRHLASHLAPIPPQRRHDRYRVKHRMSVLHGFANALAVFRTANPAVSGMESWVVEDVSRGGFGTSIKTVPADWLKVGALLALQPEGGPNWLLGVVRRYRRESQNLARVGVEALASQVVPVELTPRAAAAFSADPVQALWLQGENQPDEACLVMPHASFDLRTSMEADLNGERILLMPLVLLEQTADYELARYRVLVAQ